MNRLPRLLSAFYDSPWAIHPPKLFEIQSFLTRAAFLGMDVEAALLSPSAVTEEQRAQWQASKQAASARAAKAKGSKIAVIQILGTIANRAENIEDASGGSSVAGIQKHFRTALADEEVRAIVLDIDSPGGSVYGLDELASEIYAGRAAKRIVAVASHMAASAAYYIGSQASEFYAPVTAEVGSIGVIMVRPDYSRFLANEGIRYELFSFGERKWEGNPFEPMSDDSRLHFQARVDEYGAMFVKAVARARGVSTKHVRENFGDGRVFGATEAKERGMIDGVKTFEQVLEKLGVGAQPAPVAARSEAAADLADHADGTQPQPGRFAEFLEKTRAERAAAAQPSPAECESVTCAECAGVGSIVVRLKPEGTGPRERQCFGCLGTGKRLRVDPDPPVAEADLVELRRRLLDCQRQQIF